jgi:hypothetical protein
MYDGTAEMHDLILMLCNFTQASKGKDAHYKEMLRASIPARVERAQNTLKALRELQGIHLSYLETKGKQLYKNAQEDEKERPEYKEEFRKSNDPVLAASGAAIKTARETVAALMAVEAKFKELQTIVNEQRRR